MNWTASSVRMYDAEGQLNHYRFDPNQLDDNNEDRWLRPRLRMRIELAMQGTNLTLAVRCSSGQNDTETVEVWRSPRPLQSLATAGPVVVEVAEVELTDCLTQAGYATASPYLRQSTVVTLYSPTVPNSGHTLALVSVNNVPLRNESLAAALEVEALSPSTLPAFATRSVDSDFRTRLTARLRFAGVLERSAWLRSRLRTYLPMLQVFCSTVNMTIDDAYPVMMPLGGPVGNWSALNAELTVELDLRPCSAALGNVLSSNVTMRLVPPATGHITGLPEIAAAFDGHASASPVLSRLFTVPDRVLWCHPVRGVKCAGPNTTSCAYWYHALDNMCGTQLGNSSLATNISIYNNTAAMYYVPPPSGGQPNDHTLRLANETVEALLARAPLGVQVGTYFANYTVLGEPYTHLRIASNDGRFQAFVHRADLCGTNRTVRLDSQIPLGSSLSTTAAGAPQLRDYFAPYYTSMDTGPVGILYRGNAATDPWVTIGPHIQCGLLSAAVLYGEASFRAAAINVQRLNEVRGTTVSVCRVAGTQPTTQPLRPNVALLPNVTRIVPGAPLAAAPASNQTNVTVGFTVCERSRQFGNQICAISVRWSLFAPTLAAGPQWTGGNTTALYSLVSQTVAAGRCGTLVVSQLFNTTTAPLSVRFEVLPREQYDLAADAVAFADIPLIV